MFAGIIYKLVEVKLWQSVDSAEQMYLSNQRLQEKVSALFVVQSWQSKNKPTKN